MVSARSATSLPTTGFCYHLHLHLVIIILLSLSSFLFPSHLQPLSLSLAPFSTSLFHPFFLRFLLQLSCRFDVINLLVYFPYCLSFRCHAMRHYFSGRCALVLCHRDGRLLIQNFVRLRGLLEIYAFNTLISKWLYLLLLLFFYK